MPNFSKDRSGFNMENPMDKVEVKGDNGKLPGMIGMRSDNPSPNKFLGAALRGVGKIGKKALNVMNPLKGGPIGAGIRAMKGGGGAGGGGDLEGRVSALEAQAGGGAQAGAGEAGPTDATGMTDVDLMKQHAENQAG